MPGIPRWQETMWTDPIVEEVRSEREAHASRFDFDVAAICRELQQLQEREVGRSVVLPPEKAQRKPSSAA